MRIITHQEEDPKRLIPLDIQAILQSYLVRFGVSLELLKAFSRSLGISNKYLLKRYLGKTRVDCITSNPRYKKCIIVYFSLYLHLVSLVGNHQPYSFNSSLPSLRHFIMCDTTNHIRDVADAIHQRGFTYLGAGAPLHHLHSCQQPPLKWERRPTRFQKCSFFEGYLKHKLLNMIVDS